MSKPASLDQPFVIQTAWQAIEQWDHSPLGLNTVLDLNAAREAIGKKHLFCFPYATLKSIFSKELNCLAAAPTGMFPEQVLLNSSKKTSK